MKVLVEKLIRSLREAFPQIVPKEGYAEFDVDQSGLKKMTDSKVKLLDPDILIDRDAEQVLFTDHSFVDVSTSPYPDNAVKAVWNIAVRTKKILDEGIIKNAPSYSSILQFILTNFCYLDTYQTSPSACTFLLKIADDKTLALAKIYLAFVNEVVKDLRAFDFLQEIPYIPFVSEYLNEKMRDTKKYGHAKAKEIYNQLAKIIKQYEARKQGQSSINDNDDVDRLISKNLLAISFFEKLKLQENTANSDPSLSAKKIFEQIKNLSCASIVAYIQSEIEKNNTYSSEDEECIYIPRMNDNFRLEIDFLIAANSNDVPVFASINNKQERADGLTRYLKQIEVNQRKVTTIQNALPLFINNLFMAKLALYEQSLKIVEDLPRDIINPHEAAESLARLLAQLNIDEDIKAIESLLGEAENAAVIEILGLNVLSVHLAKLKAMLAHVENAKQKMVNFLGQCLVLESQDIIRTVPIQRIAQTTPCDFIIDYIAKNNITQTQILSCYKQLQIKYSCCPAELFKLLADHISLMDQCINHAGAELFKLIKADFSLTPVALKIIEDAEQKQLAIDHVKKLTISNESLNRIKQFVEAITVDNNITLLELINTIIKGNAAEIDRVNALIEGMNSFENLVKKLQLAQTDKQEHQIYCNKLAHRLDAEKKRLKDAAQVAGDVLQVIGFDRSIDEERHKLSELKSSMLIIDPEAKKKLEAELARLTAVFTANTSAPSLTITMFASILPTYDVEKKLKGIDDQKAEIAAIRLKIEQLNDPVLRHKKSCEVIEQKIRALELQRETILKSAAVIQCDALVVYIDADKNVNIFAQELNKQLSRMNELNIKYEQLNQEVSDQLHVLITKFKLCSINQCKMISNLGMPEISLQGIRTIENDFNNSLLQIKLSDVESILLSISTMPCFEAQKSFLADLKQNLQRERAIILDCLGIHETLSQLQDKKTEIYNKHFARNPLKQKSVAPKDSEKSPEILLRIHSIFARKATTEAITPEVYLNTLDEFFVHYITANKISELRQVLKNGLLQFRAKEQRAVSKERQLICSFIETVSTEIEDLELLIQQMCILLARKTGVATEHTLFAEHGQIHAALSSSSLHSNMDSRERMAAASSTSTESSPPVPRLAVQVLPANNSLVPPAAAVSETAAPSAGASNDSGVTEDADKDRSKVMSRF